MSVDEFDSKIKLNGLDTLQGFELGSTDAKTVKELLARLLVRNHEDRAQAIIDRTNFLKNMATLNTEPSEHLAYVLYAISALVETGNPPTFELGLIMGSALVYCSGTDGGRAQIKMLLSDLKAKQDNIQPEPPLAC